jgi:hypothetical protein
VGALGRSAAAVYEVIVSVLGRPVRAISTPPGGTPRARAVSDSSPLQCKVSAAVSGRWGQGRVVFAMPEDVRAEAAGTPRA